MRLWIVCLIVLTPTAVRGADVFIPSMEVQTALGVSSSGQEALAAIQEYLQTASAKAKAMQQDDDLVWRIAESLQRGIEPDSLTRRAVRGVTLAASYANDDQGRLESAGQTRLRRALITRAESSTDPVRARTYARAALIVISQNRFFGIDNLEGYCRADRPDSKLVQAAQLTRAERSAIQQTVEKIRVPREAVIPHLRVAGNELAALIEDPANAQRWASSGRKLCEAVELGVPAGTGRIDYQWGLLANAWRAVCLARYHRQAEFIEQMRGAMGRLRSRVKDPIVLQWIAQVTELPGDAPKHPAWRVVDDPNQMKRGRPD